MRIRLLVFLPVALLMTMLCLLSASSLVSAVEAALPSFGPKSLDLRLYETTCHVLAREIREIGRRATRCDRDLLCLGSPILCPILLEEEDRRRYERLQARFEEDCIGASRDAEPHDAQRRFLAEIAYCDAWEEVGESSELPSRPEPASFVF